MPTTIGKKEISVYEGETLNIKKFKSAILPIVNSNIIVLNEAINGIQKGLLILNLLFNCSTNAFVNSIKLLETYCSLMKYQIIYYWNKRNKNAYNLGSFFKL